MDINKLAEELKKIKPFPNAPPEIFVALRELLPMVAVELFVVKGDGSFALIKKSGEFNGWSLPGGYVGLNESFEEACQRVAKRELSSGLKSVKFLDVFNWPEKSIRGAKGHAVSLLFKCTAGSSSKMAQYFFSVPEGTLKHQAVVINKMINKGNRS